MAVIVTNIFCSISNVDIYRIKTPQLAWSELSLCPAVDGRMGSDGFIPSYKMTPRGLKLLFVCQLVHLLLSENPDDKPDGKER